MREELAAETYDCDHAAEWMEKHPYGFYNSEEDYGLDEENISVSFPNYIVEDSLDETIQNIENKTFGFSCIGISKRDQEKKLVFYMEDADFVDFSDKEELEKYEIGQKEAAKWATSEVKKNLQEAFPEWTVVVPTSWRYKYGISAASKKPIENKKVKLENGASKVNQEAQARGERKLMMSLSKKIDPSTKNIIGTNVNLNSKIKEMTEKDVVQIMNLLTSK